MLDKEKYKVVKSGSEPKRTTFLRSLSSTYVFVLFFFKNKKFRLQDFSFSNGGQHLNQRRL